MKAKNYDEALRVIKTVGEDFQKSGKWTTVARWIEALPENMRLSDPELVLLQAQSLIHLGETDEAIHDLTSLLGQVVNKENWLYRAKALSWRSAAFRLAGLFTEAKSDIKTAIRLLEQQNGPADILGDARRRLGNIYAEQGQFPLALRQLKRALKNYSTVFDAGQMAAVHNSLGIIHKRLGDLTKANMHFEHARQGWQKVKNYGSLAMTLNNMGNIYRRQGQYDLALDTFRSGLERARETGYRRAEALIFVNMAGVLRDLDLYDEALAAYHRGLELAREVMEAYCVALATVGIGETYRLLGAHDKAEVLLKEAISQSEEHGQTYEATLFAIPMGIIEYERGQYETAVRILRGVSDRLRDIGDKDALAKTYFHLAQASFLTKRYELALSWLEEASQLADELGYEDFLAVEGRNSALLIQYGASKGVGGNRFVRIMDKIRRQRESRRRPETADLSAASGEVAKPDIEARALGETCVLLNSHPISEAEWRSSKAKEIFFYLLPYATGQTKEQVTAAMWPDLSPPKCTSNFHINLYRVRRAIFPGIFTLEQARYKINTDINIWFDVAEFESRLSRAQSLVLNDQARAIDAERAIDLYKGPFLAECYSEWAEVRRRELELKYLRALSLLASFYAKRGEYDRAIALLEKSITVDPYQESVYYQIMMWQLTIGDRDAMFLTYKRYLHTTDGETDSTTSANMRELLHRIS
ncbi:MAG: tetratricopeptide repeat protein [Chloroflexi bacterium]|nr:tetratricopeptide repeat protein [Chloroflexota bacterium]